MWRLSRSKSRFLGKSNGIDITIFWSKCDSIPTSYRPRGTGDRCRRSQNGFYTPTSLIMQSAEEFISATLNIGAKKLKSNQHQILYKKSNRNWIESGKTHNRHITRWDPLSVYFGASTLSVNDSNDIWPGNPVPHVPKQMVTFIQSNLAKDQLVTPRGWEWIRPILTPMVPWTQMSRFPNGIWIGSPIFAQLTHVHKSPTSRLSWLRGIRLIVAAIHYMVPWTNYSHSLKWHLDQFICFWTIPTHRHTDHAACDICSNLLHPEWTGCLRSGLRNGSLHRNK